jgi:hypothetical protein
MFDVSSQLNKPDTKKLANMYSKQNIQVGLVGPWTQVLTGMRLS